jgi:hypothetical protein
VSFDVTDTGIGIPPEDQERIFEEFTQVENPLQHRVKGTGLGLPLSRKLAELLGGRVTVRSTVGVGSTFCAVIPTLYLPKSGAMAKDELFVTERSGRPVLIVENDARQLTIYDRYLRDSAFRLVPARSLGKPAAPSPASFRTPSSSTCSWRVKTPGNSWPISRRARPPGTFPCSW